MATYKVLVGIDYGDKRAEAGETVSDLPTKSISWLLEQGIIESADGSDSGKSFKKTNRVEEVIQEEVA